MLDKKDLKYPIKYAVMPIKEQIGWSNGLNELEREYGVVANIVSKCYVIGEQKKYSSDGTIEIKYEVVFLYNKQYTSYYDKFKPSIPEFNIWSQCTNSIFVNQLFNSFEEALIVAKQFNDEIVHHKIMFLHFDKDFQSKVEKIKTEHQETLDKYKKIEEEIQQETNNVEITKTSTLEDIIEKIVESPRKFYINLADSLSIEEREYLKKLINNRCCDNCTNGSCRVETCEKIGLDELGKSQGSNCLSWNNYELIGRQRVLTKNIL